MNHKTINSFTSKPLLELAMAQIDPDNIRRDIQRLIERLVEVKSPLAKHYQGIVNRCDTLEGIYRDTELKRIGLSLSLIQLGDL